MTSVKRPVRTVLAGVICTVLISGCTTSETESFLREAKTRVTNAVNAILGKPPVAVAPRTPAEEERALKESAELLREMFQVVLLREPYGPDEFGGYVNALSQGGSLEGIYNGFVNSQHYLTMEEKAAPADAKTARVFAEEISVLQKELASMKARYTDMGVAAPFEPEKYETVFRTASLLRLKRLLSQEALKLLEAKRGSGESREAVAQWYSAWATRLAGRQVDFGLPLRNKADVEFHKQWVSSLRPEVFSDRVIWEVVNRLHRLLNVTEAKTR